MLKSTLLKLIFAGAACVVGLTSTAQGKEFNIPAGSLNAALNAYSSQAGVALIVSADMVRGATTKGVEGNLSADEALWDELFPAEQARIVQLLVERIDIDTEGLDIQLRMEGLSALSREFHQLNLSV